MRDRLKAKLIVWAIEVLSNPKKHWIGRKILVPLIRMKIDQWFQGDEKIANDALRKHRSLKEIKMDKTGTKKWYKSKGVIGGIVGGLAGLYGLLQFYVLPQFGVNIPDIPGWIPAVLNTLGFGGGALAAYGRMKADQEIE